ncbi:MAG TPA: CDP-glucose 4,6-dehydratase [Acidobacteriaceae bacterium]|nr:CDP-glucose 4,6-dehydratase [Acidobacteriaceae bacterium]
MSFWHGRRVFVTGHTGFKGGWLSLWLEQLGAEVCGVALDPPTDPCLFNEARVGQGIRSEIADIRDLEHIRTILQEYRPEIVFHMAAEPLVRKSYEDPVGTYSTNVMGTVNVLESVRGSDSVRAVVVITTDKCYENREWIWPYRETDRLGGYDPYSNSKACAELVVSAYRNSFFPPAQYGQHGLAIASARAGNVIGGGDWAEDRLVPDIMRAFAANEVLKIRNPSAVRPWQHVLEPLSGYLKLAERLIEAGGQYGDAWNFGPEHADAKPVEWIVRELAKMWGADAHWQVDGHAQPHEAQMLKLDCSKAVQSLDWRPALTLKQALRLTADWYRRWNAGEDARDMTLGQIKQYILLSKDNRERAASTFAAAH